jgi:hypothetical protein
MMLQRLSPARFPLVNWFGAAAARLGWLSCISAVNLYLKRSVLRILLENIRLFRTESDRRVKNLIEGTIGEPESEKTIAAIGARQLSMA